MKNRNLYLVFVLMALFAGACSLNPDVGGGSFDQGLAQAGTVVPSPEPSPTSPPELTETPTLAPTATATSCPEGVIDIGDPAAWVEGATVRIRFSIPDGYLPAELRSNLNEGMTFNTPEEVSRGVSYGILSVSPTPERVFTLTLNNGVSCSESVTIIAATATLLPTETLMPTATPAPTETTVPTSTLFPTAPPTRTPTVTPGMAPVTGGEEEPRHPFDLILEFILDLFGW